MAEIIKLDVSPRHIQITQKLLGDISDEDGLAVVRAIGEAFLQEIKDGIDGKTEGGFFAMVDAMYDEVTPHGCYFCDVTVDVNELDFNENTVICMSCRTKLYKRDSFYARTLERE